MATPGIVDFDYAYWIQSYPEFSTVNESLADIYFAQAQIYLNNTPTSPVIDYQPKGQRAILLNMLVSHIAQLNANAGKGQAVGRISNATEGSVSVALDMGTQPRAAAWYLQTIYGANYWQATMAYRAGGRYYRGRTPYLGVSPYGFARGPIIVGPVPPPPPPPPPPAVTIMIGWVGFPIFATD